MIEKLTEKELEKLLEEKRNGKKKGRFSKLIVCLIVALNILFTIAVLFVFLRTGNEPTSLVVAWFAFTTGELWLLAGIKKNKKDGI